MENINTEVPEEIKLDELKEWFLRDLEENGYSEHVLKNNRVFLNRIRNFEVNCMDGKLITEYNYDEIILLLKSFGSKSTETLRRYIYIISDFFNFCRREYKMDDNIDYLLNMNKEVLEKCVDKQKYNKKYIHRNDLYTRVDLLLNNSDKALILLIFEGVLGEGFSELINLKKSDIDFQNNFIKVNDKKIYINEKLKHILEKTIMEEDVYVGNDLKYKKEKLVESEFLFRPTQKYANVRVAHSKNTGDYSGKQLTSSRLNTHLHKCLKEYTQTPYLTSISIYRSGLMERVVRMLGSEFNATDFARKVIENSNYSINRGYLLYREYKNFISDNE